MKLIFRDIEYDLDDAIDSYFLNENIIQDQYRKSKLDIGKRVDYSTRIYNRDLKNVLHDKAMHGSWDFARDNVNTYDTDKFEKLTDDYCILRKKTDKEYDTLVITFPSFAGPEGRFTSNRTNVSERLIDQDTDLLIVNEDPFRMPESLYPSNLMLGISDTYNTVELAVEKIRECITKEYKNIVIHVESKHAAAGATYAIQLNDIVTHLFVMTGATTFKWDKSPWVQKYLKWASRPESLKDQFLDMPDVQFMHIIKTYNFKKMRISDKILDPFAYIGDYDIKIDYYHGKYDTDFISFKKVVEEQNIKNLTMHTIDYKISDTQTHNIKPHLDRYIIPEYIKSLR
jgi:hypothetical protein